MRKLYSLRDLRALINPQSSPHEKKLSQPLKIYPPTPQSSTKIPLQVLEIFYVSSNCRHQEQEQGWGCRRQEVATGAITKGREEDTGTPLTPYEGAMEEWSQRRSGRGSPSIWLAYHMCCSAHGTKVMLCCYYFRCLCHVKQSLARCWTKELRAKFGPKKLLPACHFLHLPPKLRHQPRWALW